MSLLLASSSPIRRSLLAQAGATFTWRSPDVDETAIKAEHAGDTASLALRLAKAKALALGQGDEAWVIGSDSLVEVDGRRFDKPADKDDAAAHLRAFSGELIELTSAVALAKAGRIDWHVVDTAQLHVRPLSDSFIASYLDAEWPDVAYCVGVFRLEGRGIQLFERIEGSHFTILGLPLLPLLGALRTRGEMPR